MKTFLHVGCGKKNKSHSQGFNNDNWKEIRFDIDKTVKPDIEGTITDMKLVKTASIDAIYSSHNIEHVFPHEVPIVLREFHRVLKDDGMVVLKCPDIQSVGEAVAQDKLFEPLYEAPIGPVTAFDILYGHRKTTSGGNEYMAHKCGFTYSLLNSLFYEAGFKARLGGQGPVYQLSLVALKQKKSEDELKEIAAPFLPWFSF
jgi:SAM-dependent methyltransferase